MYGCIGLCSVAYLAKVFAESLRDQFLKDYGTSVYKFDRKEVLCAQIAGLCHDLGRKIQIKNDVHSDCHNQ